MPRALPQLFTTTTTATRPRALGPGWSPNKGGGGTLPLSTVTAGEPWWHCYVKAAGGGKAADGGRLPAAAAAERAAIGGPVKSNISSGVIGMPFVEAPAIFKRNGLFCTHADRPRPTQPQRWYDCM